MTDPRDDRSAAENKQVSDDIVSLIPALRAFGWTLTRRHQEVDDLVQETLLKALKAQQRFQPGSNLRAWLFTIMRNTFYTRVKIAARERPGSEDCVANTPWVPPTQDWSVRGNEVMKVIFGLPAHYREMLILVVMLGESYEASAAICNVAVGTVKSRVNRARNMVMDALGETTV